MMTKEDAKRAVEAELHSQKLTKPMTVVEMTDFCQEMYKRLEFKSDSERLADIRKAVLRARPPRAYSVSDCAERTFRTQNSRPQNGWL